MDLKRTPAIFKLKRGTLKQWTESNPILLEGEVSYTKDKKEKIKVGDGITEWKMLPYIVGGISVIPGGIKGELLRKKSNSDYDLEWYTLKLNPILGANNYRWQ